MDIEHWSVTALELFLTVLFLIFDFYFGWQYSHLVTWILATVAIAGSIVIVLPYPHGLVTGLVALIIGIATLYVLPAMEPSETETHGWIVPANDPSPPNPCEGWARFPIPPKAIVVYLGSNSGWTTSGQTILQVHGRSLISYERNNKGEITFSGDIFDETGNLVAHIERGEFHLVQSAMSYDKRSEDRSTLAEYDRQGHEVLYLRFLNPRAILVRGIFRAPGLSQPLVIDNDKMILPIGAISTRSCFGSARVIYGVQ
jgi:hypothetical protein